MKIIKPSVSLHTPFGPLTEENGLTMLRWIEFNARISHRTEERQTDDSWRRFLKAHVVEHGDWSVTEHASVTAILRVDRGVTHELVRHRLFSYTQESTRFVNYRKFTGEEGIEFLMPIGYEDVGGVWEESIRMAESTYFTMLAEGASPQKARSVLPNALAATISMTGNLRNWRLFFMSRVNIQVTDDFRVVSDLMLLEFKRIFPILYDDIEIGISQIKNLSRAR